MSDKLFDDLRSFLDGDTSEPTNQATPSAKQDDDQLDAIIRQLMKHPFLMVNDDGVPAVTQSSLGQFFPQSQWEVIKAESMIAYGDLIESFTKMEDDGSSDAPNFGHLLVGDAIEHDPNLALKVMARLSIMAAFLSAASLRRGVVPSKDGVFAGHTEVKLASHAVALLSVIKALSAPLRAEYMMDATEDGNA